ncbi:gastrula zinc finger protein XlCGF57.1-like isoform X3 [Hyperolius riggenbachi]
MVPPSHSLIHKRKKKKILEITSKITKLLVVEDVDGCLEAQKDKDGDVLIEDQKTYKMFKKDEDEEVQYLEGHNDTMLENQLPLTSPDVSNVFSYRNPPERSTGSLYSQDCSQEDPSIPHHYQAELKSMKLEEEETYVRGEQKTAQSDEMEATKEERETCVKGNSRSTEEGVMLGTIKKEEEELKCWAGGDEVGSNTMEPLMSHPDDAAEDNGVTQCSAEEIYITVNTHHRGSSAARGAAHFSGEESFEKSKAVSSVVHEPRHKADTGTEPYNLEGSSCTSYYTTHTIYQRLANTECSMSETSLAAHQNPQSHKLQWSCTECGKNFNWKGSLYRHQRMHTGERPFSCSVCGKCFTRKGSLQAHQRSHTGDRPYSCAECGKCYMHKQDLLRHQKCHTGERPYSCSECGKCFNEKKNLLTHQRIHTGERPFLCLECGKNFNDKTNFGRHQKIHNR